MSTNNPSVTVDTVEHLDGSAETVVRFGFGRVVDDPVEVIAALMALTDRLAASLVCPGHGSHPSGSNRAERRAARRR